MSDQPALAWIKTTDTQEGVQIVWDWEEVEPVGTITVDDQGVSVGAIFVQAHTPLSDLPKGEYLIMPKEAKP